MTRRATVRHDAQVIAQRPHTKTYPAEARERLALAVMRGREAAGYKFRPAFAQDAKIGVRSLLNLESAKPVGPIVYESVARALPNWDEDTPRLILDGGPIPPTATEQQSRDEWEPRDEMERKIMASSLPRAEKIDLVRGYRDALEEERMLFPDRDRHPHSATSQQSEGETLKTPGKGR
jgi:hypothetical protein